MRRAAVGLAGLAAAGALAVPVTLSQGGGTVDVFVGSTPTPVATPTATATPSTLANLFVDTTTTGNTCTRSSSVAAYSSNAACNTFDAAYQAATQGDLVFVKAGTYAAQTVADDAGKHTGLCDVGNTSPCVTFKPYPSDSVTLTDLTNHAWNTYYDGFTFTRNTSGTDNTGDGGPSITQGTGVVMANMRATQFFIQSQLSTNPVVNAHVYGGEYGPLKACPGGGYVIGDDSAGSTLTKMPKNVTIEGIYAHDEFVIGACVGNNALDHMDCVHVRQTRGFFRFIRNRLTNCEDYALLLEGSPDAAWDVTIANNMVGPNLAGTESLAFHGGVSTDTFQGTVRVVNNSTDGSITPATNSTLSGDIVFANNYAPSVSCRAEVTYSHDIMSTGPGCAASDVTGTTFGWVSRSTGDLHLTAGASAINAGDNTYCPTTDLDGETRSGTCDAGADQP